MRIPKITKTLTWPNDICSDGGSSKEEEEKKPSLDPSLLVGVTPAWENIQSEQTTSTSKIHVPSSIQQRFWVKNYNDFKEALMNVKSR